MEYTVNSLLESKAIAIELAKTLKPGDVVAFHGGMGAGKTTFSGYFLEALGYEGAVTSPTFALVHEYPTPHFPVAHFDFYRLENEDDLYSTGYFDFLDGNHVLFIEWSENIPEAIPHDATHIWLETTGESSRHIRTEKGESL